jgi:translation initiation factor IF-2
VEPDKAKIEEKRLKPTLIRRRKKEPEVVPPEPETAEGIPAAEGPPDVLMQGAAEEAMESPVTKERAAPEVSEAEKPAVKEAEEEEPEVVPEKVPSEVAPAGEEVLRASKEAPSLEEPPARGEPAEEEARGKPEKLEEGPEKKRVVFRPKPAAERDLEREKEKRRGRVYRPVPPRKKKALSLVKGKKTEITVPRAIKRKIRIVEAITVGELAKRMGVKAREVMKRLMELGVMATINKEIDSDAAALVAHQFDYEVETVPVGEELLVEEEPQVGGEFVERAPVVTVMGHVDHGKTSLLDAIRETNVIAGEAGGITQHIGAYHVRLDRGEIVFIDTPGHEAFTAMRARGAQVTDIVILVVAADDGVKSQTIEAIDHAKAAKVPIVVAINKIDKPEADSAKVRRALSEHGLVPEEWGGDTIFVEVSAKQRTGIQGVLEMILLQAEMLELKADAGKAARGTIIEAKLDRGHGSMATVLIQHGTLKAGDAFVSGVHFGRVKIMFDDRGARMNEAGPATPVEIVGLSGVPSAGDSFVVVDDERKARQVSVYRQEKHRQSSLNEPSRVSLEGFHAQMAEGETKELNLVIKGDVQGTIEALTQSLCQLGTEEAAVNIIHTSAGTITQSDVILASASQAIIIGFGVKPDANAVAMAEQEGVDIRLYQVIYDVVSDITSALEGLLSPILTEKPLGLAEVVEVFHIRNVGTVAGCRVTEGKVVRDSQGRLTRNGSVVFEGKIASLRRYKDEAKEVPSGQECGLIIEGFEDFEVGDRVESLVVEETPSRL